MKVEIGRRLREERNRLGMNQQEFAAAAGASLRSVADWEAGRSSPNSEYVAILSAKGLDALYVLTGTRGIPIETSMSPDEQTLVENYRRSDAEDRAALRKMGDAFGRPRRRSASNG